MINSFNKFNEINENMNVNFNIKFNIKENQIEPDLSNSIEKNALNKIVAELKKFHSLKQKVKFITVASASSKSTKIIGGNKKIAMMRAYNYSKMVRDLLAKQGINIREVACGKSCSRPTSKTDSTLIGSFVDRRGVVLPSTDKVNIYISFKLAAISIKSS